MSLNNHDQYQQLVLFDGMEPKNTNISPTDIDYMIEFKQKKALVVGEIKYKNVFVDIRVNQPLQYGQRRCLTEIVDNAQKAGKEAILFVVTHSVELPGKALARKALVKWFYYKKEWEEVTYKITFKKAQNRFLKRVGVV